MEAVKGKVEQKEVLPWPSAMNSLFCIEIDVMHHQVHGSQEGEFPEKKNAPRDYGRKRVPREDRSFNARVFVRGG